MRHRDGGKIWELELELGSVVSLWSAQPRRESLEEELREPRVIRVASRTIAIWQHPFRVLRQESIVHLALKPGVSRSFSGES